MSNLPHKPVVADPVLQKWINHVHAWVNAQPPRRFTPPGLPSGLAVIPGPGMNRVTFTGGQGAESHIVLASPQPVWNPTNTENHIFDIGRGTEFPHVIGVPAKSYYYWVIAVRGGLKSDPPTGPVKGTTLALGTPLTPSSATKQSPGNVVKSSTTQLPTVTLSTLTKGSLEP